MLDTLPMSSIILHGCACWRLSFVHCQIGSLIVGGITRQRKHTVAIVVRAKIGRHESVSVNACA